MYGGVSAVVISTTREIVLESFFFTSHGDKLL